MSIQGKKIAMVNHALSVAQSIRENLKPDFNNPFLMEVTLFRIRLQAVITRSALQSTPAERFNDDGTLKPAPELQHGEWHVKMGGLRYRLEDECVPREPKNFEVSV